MDGQIDARRARRPHGGFSSLSMSWTAPRSASKPIQSCGTVLPSLSSSVDGKQGSETLRQPTTSLAWFPRPANNKRLKGSTNSIGKGRVNGRLGSYGAGIGMGGSLILGGSAKAAWLWPFGSKKKGTPKEGGKKRVLIMISDTGGGHRASAQALRAGFEKLYGSNYRIDIVDMFAEHTPWPFNQGHKSYAFLVHHSMLWRLGYYSQQPRIFHVPNLRMYGLMVGRWMGQAFDKYKPDLVVSVHPLLQHIPIRILEARVRSGKQKKVPFATVVTDLTTCHNTWFHPRVDRCFVATEEARTRALRMGLKPRQITIHGLPIRPAFSHKFPAKPKLRRHLGMDPHTPAVLLVGGGEGMGGLEATVDALEKSVGGGCQVVVVCGRNEKLARRIREKAYPSGMKVVVKGFVDNMEDWMNAVDTIVTKAGPGTISESLICGLPVLLNGFIPCQEAGNVSFVIDNKAGAFERDPVKIADIISSWFGEKKAEFAKMGEAAKKLGAPFSHALFDIVRDLDALVITPA